MSGDYRKQDAKDEELYYNNGTESGFAANTESANNRKVLSSCSMTRGGRLPARLAVSPNIATNGTARAATVMIQPMNALSK